MTSASIVINTLNRANLLSNTLESFLHLDFESFEVIVVNGPSTDRTVEVLEKWKEKIKIGNCPEPNLSMSRNIGIAMAAGDVVVFIDDDAIPEPEWLDQIMAGFDSPEVAATGGKVFDHTGHSFQYQYANADRLGRGKWQLSEPSLHYCFPRAFEFPYLQGTNTAFRRTALLEIGGFDEEFAYYLDEVEVCLRLVDRGYVIRQLPNAYVHHKYAPSHIRTKSAAIYRYPVLKSKVYFSSRHAPSYCSPYEIDVDNGAFMQSHRNDVLHCVRTGRLSRADLEKFEEHVEEALRRGKAAALQSPKLITDDLLLQHASPFKKFAPRITKSNALVIVLLCEDYPPDLLGGIARFTQDKATALARLGHRVHVIARGHSHSTVDFEAGVWVHRIVPVGDPIPGEFAALNIPQSHWDQSKSFLDEIDRIAEHRKVDIVEGPLWNIVGIAPLLSRRYVVVTSLMTTLKLSLPSRPDLTQNPEAMATLVDPLVAMERCLLTHSHAILAISQGIANEIEAAYDIKIGCDRLFVSHLGMPDWAHGYETLEGEKSAGAIDILFVGRLEKRKGIDLLLEIAPGIAQEFPDVQFHIVGDDRIPSPSGNTFRQEFERQHARLCGSQVRFYGKVDEESLRHRYATCDVFVAPSRFESFGLIYLEAMMFGKPVIGCDIGGIPEVVEDGENGLLVGVDDKDGLRYALVKLIADGELRERLGSNGRTRYLLSFTDEKMAVESERLYVRVLRGTGKVSITTGRVERECKNKLLTALACPHCKSPLMQKSCQRTIGGVVKYGALFCNSCNLVVASIKYGKIDFLRLDSHYSKDSAEHPCDEFYYKRVPWSDNCVSSISCRKEDLGWNSEGFSGCLCADSSSTWQIRINTDATDLSLRFLSHERGGCVNVTLNEAPLPSIDLCSSNDKAVRPFEIYRNLLGNKTIVIGQGIADRGSKNSQVFFFGMDACFAGRAKEPGGNRGNGFPAAYQWVLDNLSHDAMALDCGSGDRKHPDERIISFEYMPFEFPEVFGDGHALPFADATFDAVFSQAVMEHMRDPYHAAREISRVTKPGGIVYVESAFMQPLHAVPYHFFNTTTWGIEAIFADAGVTAEVLEWFGPLSSSLEWYLNACGGGGLDESQRNQVRELFAKVDSNVAYEQLKPVASAVSLWGVKCGEAPIWKKLLDANDRPTFKYALA